MDVMVFVEVPMGSRNKYEVDAETGHVVLDRRLFTSMSYPADYGFIEGTLGEDGDPLDALVLVGEPTFPGCRIRARVVGVFHMTDEKGPDEKVILVPLKDPAWMRVHDIHDIPPEYRDEIEHFFQVYKDLEEKKTETRGFGNRAEAEAVIDEARAASGLTLSESVAREAAAAHEAVPRLTDDAVAVGAVAGSGADLGPARARAGCERGRRRCCGARRRRPRPAPARPGTSGRDRGAARRALGAAGARAPGRRSGRSRTGSRCPSGGSRSASSARTSRRVRTSPWMSPASC